MRALLIPANPATAIGEVDVDASSDATMLAGLQALVGGWVQMVAHPFRDDVIAWVNEEGRLVGLPANIRATAAVSPGLRRPISHFLVGDCVLTGYDQARGATWPLPDDVTARHLP